MESLKAYDSDSSDKDSDIHIKVKPTKTDPMPMEPGVKRTEPVTSQDYAVTRFTSRSCDPRSSTAYCYEGFKKNNFVHENLITCERSESIVVKQPDKNNWRSTLAPGTFENRTERTVTSGMSAGNRNVSTANLPPFCANRTSHSPRSVDLAESNSNATKVRGYVSKRKREFIEQNQSKVLRNTQKETERTRSHKSLAVTVDSNEMCSYHMVSNSVTEEKRDEDIIIVNRPPKKLHVKLQRHTKGVNCVRWNPVNINVLLSASMDQSVCIWDALEKKDCVLQLTCHDGAVKDARWSSNGSYLLSCGYDKMARITDINTGVQIQQFPHTDYVTCICYKPNNQNIFLSGTFKSGISSWDIRGNKVISKYQASFGQVQDLVFLPGGEEFLSASEVIRRNATDKGIMAWDFKSTAVLSNQIYQEAFTCTCLRVHPQGTHFLAQSSGNYVAIFSTKRPYIMNKYKRFEGHQVSGYHIGCDISTDGSLVASGSTDGSLYIYNHKSSRVIRTLPAYSGVCMDVAFHPLLSSTVASCSWNGDVSVWQ